MNSDSTEVNAVEVPRCECDLFHITGIHDEKCPYASMPEVKKCPSNRGEHIYKASDDFPNNCVNCGEYRDPNPPTDSGDDAVEGIVREFEEKLKCIDSNCDQRGNIPHQVAEGQWEAQQCEYCFVIRFPTIDWLRTTLRSYGDKILEEAMEEAGIINYSDTIASTIKKIRLQTRAQVLATLEERIKAMKVKYSGHSPLGKGAEAAVEYVAECSKDTFLSLIESLKKEQATE